MKQLSKLATEGTNSEIVLYVSGPSYDIRLALRVDRLLATLARGRAEKEPRISIPVPAVPVSELLAGKNRKICKSLN